MYCTVLSYGTTVTKLFHFAIQVWVGGKLRFNQRKNYERKKCSLCVRIPLSLVKPTELVVCLPLSAFLSSEARDAEGLLSRIRASNTLPTSWMLPEMPTSSDGFMLCKLQQHLPLSTPSFIFTVTVNANCTWTLVVESHEIDASSCDLLSMAAPTYNIFSIYLYIIHCIGLYIIIYTNTAECDEILKPSSFRTSSIAARSTLS